MTGRDALLCSLLGCGSLDLVLLDGIEFDWDDVIDRADFESFEDADLNSLMRAVVSLGIDGIAEAIDERVSLLETLEESGNLPDDDADELRQLTTLEPREDIESFHNCLDTHVYFAKNGDIYRKYLGEPIEEFEENTGFPISE